MVAVNYNTCNSEERLADLIKKYFQERIWKGTKKYCELNQWQILINHARNKVVTKQSKWSQKSLQFTKDKIEKKNGQY